MTNIDQLLAGMDGNFSGTSTPSLSMQHQQAWLHALEKTGLNDAILQAKVFSTTNKTPVDLISKQSTTDASTQREAENTELQQRANIALPKVRQESRDENNQLRPFSNTSTADTLSTLMGIGQLEQDILKLPSNQIFNLLSKGSHFGLAWKELQYPMRNMVVTRLGEEAEIWIRDAALSEARLMEILTGVRQSMGTLGISLAKVVVNGQTIFSSQESGKELSHFKEV